MVSQSSLDSNQVLGSSTNSTYGSELLRADNSSLGLLNRDSLLTSSSNDIPLNPISTTQWSSGANNAPLITGANADGQVDYVVLSPTASSNWDSVDWDQANQNVSVQPVDVANTINNFDPTQDKILVSASGFGGDLQTASDSVSLSADQFRVGSSSVTSSDRFLYNPETGALSFDSDGSGSAEPVQVAQLSPDLDLTNENIEVRS